MGHREEAISCIKFVDVLYEYMKNVVIISFGRLLFIVWQERVREELDIGPASES